MYGYGKRVLVIDDDASCQELLTTSLEQEGYIVHIAESGSAGLEEMNKRRFDLVIADSQVPGISGLEFAVLSRATWPDTPVILLAADIEPVTEYADGHGAVACIRKPYEAPVLLSVLRAAAESASA
ncbi:MAG TPA: response regulator [Nitrospira sp.]|nr:response regulator [Nitrospira sp.]